MVAKVAEPGYAFELSSPVPSVGFVSTIYHTIPCFDTPTCGLSSGIPFTYCFCV